jgi:hypothetical protein
MASVVTMMISVVTMMISAIMMIRSASGNHYHNTAYEFSIKI